MKAPALTILTVAAAIGAAVSTIHATDKRARFESRWLTAPITVDGSPVDWPGPLAPFNDQPLSMAASNDGDSLYLVLTASEPAVRRQILRQGLIVWFDGGAKDKKKFGVKFPIGAGITAEEMAGHRHGGAGGSGTAPDPGTQDPPHGRPQEPSLEPANRLEVLGASKDDARSYTADLAPGIAVKVGQAEGLLAYELKVPLTSSGDHPYAVGAKPGQPISVGLEMPKLERPAEAERGRGGGGGGRSGGFGGGGMGGGRRGGGGGGGPHMEQGEQAKPLSGWVEVQLAARQTSL